MVHFIIFCRHVSRRRNCQALGHCMCASTEMPEDVEDLQTADVGLRDGEKIIKCTIGYRPKIYHTVTMIFHWGPDPWETKKLQIMST